MDEKRLAEIEARVKAATLAPHEPWELRESSGAGDDHLAGVYAGETALIYYEHVESAQHLGILTFIANARQDVPDLLAEVRRLRERLYVLTGAPEP